MINNNWVVQYKLPYQTKYTTLTERSDFFTITNKCEWYQKAFPYYQFKLECF